MRRLITTACALAASITLATAPGPVMARDLMLGEVFLFAGNFCPRYTLEAKGQLLEIRENTSLFSILGTMYGGDGRTNFALPNLAGVAAQKNDRPVRYCIATAGIFPSRN